MQGVIFDIKHYAIHDGPGIRQTIFFKGCALGCWWCHNPESRSHEPFTYMKKEKIDGREVNVKETVGKRYTVNELLKIIEKDRVFFEESGGGVTISGGEPLQQFDFLLKLLKACKEKDIHTCLDTTGFTQQDKIAEVARYTDHFLYDIKHVDSDKHKEYTGVPNETILENLGYLDSIGKNIWIRYVLVPGINDDESDLLKLLAYLNKLKNVKVINILPYHKIGSHKYHRFGLEYKMNGVQKPKNERLKEVSRLFKNAGFEVTIGG
jgi:pyruvate formate lyase activating enzyme